MNAIRMKLVDSNRSNPGTNHYDFGQGGAASRMVGPLFQRSRRDMSWFIIGDQHRNATPFSFLPNTPHHSLPDTSVLPRMTAANFPVPFILHSAQGFEDINHTSPLHGFNSMSFIAPNSATRLPDQRSTSFHSGSASVKRYPKRTMPSLMSKRRREQCRINQARYRRNQERKLKLLIEDVCKLEEEIPVLKQKRYRLLSGFKQNVFNVIVDYFHHFQHGSLSLKSGSMKRVLDPRTQNQLVFLRSVAAPDISLGDRHGVDEHIEQWRRYSSSFDGLRFHLEYVKEIRKNFVVVSSSLTVTVIEATLENIFPHLVGTQVGDKILGQQLVLSCSVCFEWDEVHHYLVRLELVVDFFPAISRALGSIVESAFVLEQALLTPNGDIKSK